LFHLLTVKSIRAPFKKNLISQSFRMKIKDNAGAARAGAVGAGAVGAGAV
jgi:hypothetical protein